MTIDKNRVKKAFSRQAPIYEENAPLQKEVAEKLIAFISGQRSAVSGRQSVIGSTDYGLSTNGYRLKVLDIGIGTGFASREFSSRFPKAGMFGCDIAWGMLKEAVRTGAVLTEADAEHLPYKDETFDLAFSSLAFQWTNLTNSLAEAFRILRPSGLFCLSTFGEKTLKELADSYDSAWRSVGIEGTPKTMKFESSQKIKSLMESAGFKNVEVKTELINCRYHSPETLLRSLKAIGAGNPSRDFHPSRNLLQETFRIYKEIYGDEDGIPASFEVVYASGVKG